MDERHGRLAGEGGVGAVLAGVLRGGLLCLATWAAIGAVPAFLLLPGAVAAGTLERWAAGRRHAVLVGLLTWPLTATLVVLALLQGIYLRESISAGGGPLAAGRLVTEAALALPADPDPARLPAAREWLADLPWWHASDEPTWCLLAMATLVATLLALLATARLALGIGAAAGSEPTSDGRVELQARLPALITLGSTVGACALGLVWSVWLLPPPRPGDPGLQGLSLWGFSVLLGMAAPLAYGLSDRLLPLRARPAA